MQRGVELLAAPGHRHSKAADRAAQRVRDLGPEDAQGRVQIDERQLVAELRIHVQGQRPAIRHSGAVAGSGQELEVLSAQHRGQPDPVAGVGGQRL